MAANSSHYRIHPDPRAQILPPHKRAVAVSIAQFSLLEGGGEGGVQFVPLAMKMAVRIGEPDYPHAVVHWIGEEGRHSLLLRQFAEAQGIPIPKATWLTKAFAWVRHLGGAEMEVSAIICGEIIAMSYYVAARAATDSQYLRSVCDQILIEEPPHIRFQTFSLLKMREQRGFLASALTEIAHQLLMAGALAVIWKEHRAVYRLGGYSFSRAIRFSYNWLNRILRETLPGKYGESARKQLVPHAHRQ